MRHTTATELALHYSGGLNSADEGWVKAHLETCEQCAMQFEVVCATLDDLATGTTEPPQKKQFARLWKRVTDIQKAIGMPVPEEAPEADTKRRKVSATGRALAFRTSGPGLGARTGASVYAADGELDGQVCAECRMRVGADGSVRAQVRILENVDKLARKMATLYLSNNLDCVVIGPVALTRKQAEYGEILEAVFRRDPDPAGGLTREQLEGLSPDIRIM